MKIFEFSIRLVFVMVAIAYCDHHIRAQNFGGEYITEWQTDFDGCYNWANLLRLSADIKLSDHFAFQAATLSIAQTSADPIIDDLQGFSNIAEDDCALTLAMLGFGWHTDRTSLFVGIRNVNEDYFTTPFTSLFTNSSCGIYPTLSHNYEIANYPLSSWSVHFAQAWEALTLNFSVYNGHGYRRFTGHDNMFRLSPKNDGLFTITSITYNKNDSHYTFGLAAFYGVHTPEMDGGAYALTQACTQSSTEDRLLQLGYDPSIEGQTFREGTLSAGTDPSGQMGCLQTLTEGRLLNCHYQQIKEGRLPACHHQASKEGRLPACHYQQIKEGRLPACHHQASMLADNQAGSPRKKFSFSPWLNVEQTLSERWQLMVQASMSTYRHGCRYFGGAGLKYTINDIDIAVYADYASYAHDHEVASELTCRIPLSSKSYLQPAVHLISTDGDTRCVALLRYGLEF